MQTNQRQRVACTAALLLMAMTGRHATADDRGTAPHVVAPIAGQDTLVNVSLNLSRFDVDALADLLAGKAGSDVEAAAVRREIREAGQMLNALRDAGCGTLFAVLRTSDLPNLAPRVMAIMEGAGDRQRVTGILRLHLARQDEDGRIVTVPRGGASGGSPAGRWQAIDQAHRQLAQRALHVIVSPTADMQRVLAEMTPAIGVLPEGSGPVLAAIEWFALGVDLPPRTAVALRVQMRDAASAERLRQLMETMLQRANQDAGRGRVPDFVRLGADVLPHVEGRRLVLEVNGDDPRAGTLIAALASPIQTMRRQALHRRTVQQLKQLAMMMHQYHDTHGSFPAAASYDADGRPLLSWRVHLLPFLEGGQALYERFRLQEPWDSPHNRALIPQMPDVFVPLRHAALREQGKTTYLVPAGPDTLFADRQGIRYRDVPDGLSNTILIVDARRDDAVIWTRPRDLAVPSGSVPNLFETSRDLVPVALADGAVQFFDRERIQALGDKFRFLFDPDDRQSISP